MHTVYPYQKDKVQGIYMPYWTFDADTSTDYTAMGGIDYQVEYKDDKGEVHTRIETKWYPTRGHINHFFDIMAFLVSFRSFQYINLYINLLTYQYLFLL